MKIEIDMPHGCYEEIKKGKFPAQSTYRLIEWIKAGKIIKDEPDNFVEIGTVSPGTTIEVDNIRMEILAHITENNEIGVFCLAKDILFNRAFDKNNDNNWEKSSLREYLNIEYIASLDNELAGALIPFERNLLTDDGMKNYSICTDLISLISEKEYQDYRDYISDKPNCWWTLTALSANSSLSNYVRHVDTNGSLISHSAYYGKIGVSTACLLRPSLKVKIV